VSWQLNGFVLWAINYKRAGRTEAAESIVAVLFDKLVLPYESRDPGKSLAIF
jgi:hypothetical protein